MPRAMFDQKGRFWPIKTEILASQYNKTGQID